MKAIDFINNDRYYSRYTKIFTVSTITFFCLSLLVSCATHQLSTHKYNLYKTQHQLEIDKDTNIPTKYPYPDTQSNKTDTKEVKEDVQSNKDSKISSNEDDKLHYEVYNDIREIEEINKYGADEFFSTKEKGFRLHYDINNVKYAQITNLMVLCVKDKPKENDGCYLARVDADASDKAYQIVLFSKGVSDMVFKSGNAFMSIPIKGGKADLIDLAMSDREVLPADKDTAKATKAKKSKSKRKSK